MAPEEWEIIKEIILISPNAVYLASKNAFDYSLIRVMEFHRILHESVSGLLRQRCTSETSCRRLKRLAIVDSIQVSFSFLYIVMYGWGDYG